jgi:FKBP-type peptidyl-prolyl cis-trans isomerase FklB
MTQTTPKLTTEKEKASYALGLNVGNSFKRQSIDVDPDIVARGLRDAYTGAKPLLDDAQTAAALNQLKNQTMAKQQTQMEELGAKNKVAGEQFLAQNKTKEGVVTLPSGLQYTVLQQGTGPKPTASDVVVCNYRGTLLDGTEFDSSYKRGQPASFPVSGVIKGWTEALQLMPVGSKYRLFIPADLAYGERGAGGGDIPPNSTLIFEVELVSIEKK